MDGVRALRLAALDIWHESTLILVPGFIGGVLCLLILPAPLVLAVLYALAFGLTENRVSGWRACVAQGWQNGRFYYLWALATGLPLLLGGTAVYFYQQIPTWWARGMGLAALALLVLWLLPAPLAPALYWHQDDRRLRTAWRNAAILAVRDPFSLLFFWLVMLSLAAAMAYVSWPFLLFLPVLGALFSTRLVWAKLNPPAA